MTEFHEGQYIVGHYGNRWTRRSDAWYSDTSGGFAFGDDTAEWLINLKVNMVAPTPKEGGKLSKSGPPEVPTYQYKYTLKE